MLPNSGVSSTMKQEMPAAPAGADEGAAATDPSAYEVASVSKRVNTHLSNGQAESATSKYAQPNRMVSTMTQYEQDDKVQYFKQL